MGWVLGLAEMNDAHGGANAMFTRLKLMFALAAVLLSASAYADSFVYVVNGNSQFGIVDLNNGSFAPIGPGLPAGGYGMVAGPGGTLLALGYDGNLYSVNPATGVGSVIGATGLGFTGNTIGEYGGVVYAADTSNNLYTVNVSTGLATQISPAGGSGIPPDPGCGSSDLCDETIFGAGGNLYATWDEFTPSFSPVYSETIDSGPSLYEIDPTTGVATLLSSTGVHSIAATNFDGTIYGFEGFPSAFNPLPNPPIEVITINPLNGATTDVSNLDPSVGPIFAMAPASTPEPASLAFVGTGLAALAVRLRRRLSRPD